MKLKTLLLVCILIPTLAACATQPSRPANTPAAVKTFKTEIGDLAFASGRFVDEVHGVKPNAGSKLLLVFFDGVDPANFNLERFQGMQNKFLIRGDDGSETIGTMAGLVDNRFAIGFQVPVTAKAYTLVWPDQTTTEITAKIENGS